MRHIRVRIKIFVLPPPPGGFCFSLIVPSYIILRWCHQLTLGKQVMRKAVFTKAFSFFNWLFGIWYSNSSNSITPDMTLQYIWRISNSLSVTTGACQGWNQLSFPSGFDLLFPHTYLIYGQNNSLFNTFLSPFVHVVTIYGSCESKDRSTRRFSAYNSLGNGNIHHYITRHYKIKELVWHTGRVLACDAAGPRFKTRQGQGFFVRPILFCIRIAHYSSGKAGWFSPTVQLASGCMWVWFADSRFGRFSLGTPVSSYTKKSESLNTSGP